MNIDFMTPHSRPLPYALDPDLPRLAASAALEADLALSDSGSLPQFDALRTLLARLQSTEETSVGDQGMTNLVDPLSQDLVHRALARSIRCDTISQSLDELRRVTSILIKPNKPGESLISNTDLTEMRNFCIALSNYAAASRGNRLGGNGRSSPYRV